MAFNIKGAVIPPTTRFVPDASTTKQFVMMEPGADSCWMPDPSYLFNIPVILVLGRQTSPNQADCFVSRIITTVHLTACSGSPPDVNTLVKFVRSTAPLNPPWSDLEAGSMLWYDYANSPDDHGEQANYDLLSPFDHTRVDDDFVEFLILRSFYYLRKSFFSMYEIENLDSIRRAYKLSGVVALMTPNQYLQKNVMGGLRGFLLTPDAAGDDFGAYRDTLDYVRFSVMTSTIILHFYVPKANLMTANEGYVLSISTQTLDPGNPAYTLKTLSYKVKFKRLVGGSNQLDLTLVRMNGAVEEQDITLSIPYTAANEDWIHFGVTLGRGAIYYSTARTTLVFKRTEALHAWFDGNTYLKEMSKLEDDTYKSMYPDDHSGELVKVVLSIGLKAYSDAAMTTEVATNKPGIRVWEAKTIIGSYLGYKVSGTAISDNRCFLPAVLSDECYLYAFMKNKDEFQPKSLVEDKVKNRDSGCPIDKCKYCIYGFHCAFAVSGYNEDLFFDADMDFVKFNWGGLRYDSSNPDHATAFVKIQDDVGRDYWVRCPPF